MHPADVLEMQAQSLFRTLHAVALARQGGGATCDQQTFDYFFSPPVPPGEDDGIVFDRNSDEALARRFRPRDGTRRRKHKRKREVAGFERRLVLWRNAVNLIRRSRAMLPIPAAFHRVPANTVTITRIRDAVIARSALGRYCYTAEDLEEELAGPRGHHAEGADMLRRTLYLIQTKFHPRPAALASPESPTRRSPDGMDEMPVSPTDEMHTPEEDLAELAAAQAALALSQLTLVDGPAEEHREKERHEGFGSAVRRMLFGSWAQ
ncbi:hypothetical protein DFJ74DRAFT_681300 [Hyaloraphidium curvatum]|nr:hypothetical protein DFJ74DRAFT_681300 [Hyaloraphidium curvatum]